MRSTANCSSPEPSTSGSLASFLRNNFILIVPCPALQSKHPCSLTTVKLVTAQPHVFPKPEFRECPRFEQLQDRTHLRDCRNAAKAARLPSAGNPRESPAPAIRGLPRRHGDNPRKSCPRVPPEA